MRGLVHMLPRHSIFLRLGKSFAGCAPVSDTPLPAFQVFCGHRFLLPGFPDHSSPQYRDIGYHSNPFRRMPRAQTLPLTAESPVRSVSGLGLFLPELLRLYCIPGQVAHPLLIDAIVVVSSSQS